MRKCGGIALAGIVVWSSAVLGLLSAGARDAGATSGTPPIQTQSVAPGVTTGAPSVTLLEQTPWIQQKGTFRLRLKVAAADPAHDTIQVLGFDRLITRTDFDSAAQGHSVGFAWYRAGPMPLSSLPADRSGGVDIDIPVNQTPATGSSIPRFDASAGSAVFPLQIGVFDKSNVAEGPPITTFLVYAAGSEVGYGVPKLSVAVVLPVHSPPPVTPKGQL